MSPNSVDRIALGIDIATCFSSVSWMKNGKACPVKLPTGESVIPSAVLFKPGGEIVVGEDAQLQAWKYPDGFYWLFKPRLLTLPDDRIGDGPTPVELTAHLIRYIVAQLLVKHPELARYPQFGGSTRPANELELCFTMPAGWGIELREAMNRAICLAGVEAGIQPIRFKTEPAAGCRRILHECGCKVRDNDPVLCIDFGGGTLDVTLLKFDRGAFHEKAAPIGNQALGGRNFTAALAEQIAKELGVDCGNVFSQADVMCLSALDSDEQREVALNIWQAAEQMKLRLSTAPHASGFIQTSAGKREIKVELEFAQRLWAPLWKCVDELIETALLDANVSVETIPHVFVIGGSALLPGFVERVANLTKRSPDDVIFSDDSSHVVSNGAAEEAYFREDVAQLLDGGVGLRLGDDVGGHVYRMYVRPNQVIPVGGMVVEAMGQFVRSPGSKWVLLLEPFVAKPGVRCHDPLLGREVFLDEREVILLKQVCVEVELPAGQHDLKIGVAIDSQRNTNLTVVPVGLSDYEPIVVSLAMRDRHAASPEFGSEATDVVLVLDCSRSMAGEKLVQAKRAMEKFVHDVSSAALRTALVVMGGIDKATVVVPFTNDPTNFIEGMKRQAAFGGTHFTEALAVTKDLLNSAHRQCRKIVVFFSDGMPHNLTSALGEAHELKEHARLICVGIGDDALRPFLEQIASSRDDYFEAQTPHDILGCLYEVAKLVQANGVPQSLTRVASA